MTYPGSESDRRLSALIKVGTVESIDPDGRRIRIRCGTWVSPPVLWSAGNAGAVRRWSPPSVGENALLLSPSGLPEQGRAITGWYSAQHNYAPDNQLSTTVIEWPDGARETYNHDSHHYELTVPDGGSITFRVGGKSMTLSSEGFKVDGDIKATGSIMDEGGNSNHHSH